MKVNEELVNKLSNLSKLAFSESEKKHIQEDLSKILSFMEKLNELNTDGIEPLVYVNENTDSLREDIPFYPVTKEEALMNAPLKTDDYIKVPKFVKGTKY